MLQVVKKAKLQNFYKLQLINVHLIKCEQYSYETLKFKKIRNKMWLDTQEASPLISSKLI